MKHVVGDEQDAQAEAAPDSDAAVISRVSRASEVDDHDVADLLRRAAVKNKAALDRLAQ